MRGLAALASALLILFAAATPHVHTSALRSHACLACVAAGGEAAEPASPDLAPRPAFTETIPEVAPEQPAMGAPLGAVPGQSPPIA